MSFKNKHGYKAMRQIAAITIFLLLHLDNHAQDPLINLPHGNMKVRAFMDSISKEINISYTLDELDTSARIHASGPVCLTKAVHMLTEKFGLTDTIMNNPKQVFLQFRSVEKKSSPPPSSYNTYVNLTVTDDYGRLLASANLKDSITKDAYRTKENGTVIIKSSQKQVFLIATYVGMDPYRLMVSGHEPMTIHMQRSSTVMDEKIVINYGIGNRRNSTTGITAVPHDLLDPVSTLTPQTALEGIVPGLLTTRTSGMPGASAFLTIRGQSSIYNNSDPLYVIDDIIFAPGNQSMLNLPVGNSGGSLSPFSFIPPSEIEKIEVLKDADATAIYGSRGANGVILINTRRYRPKAARFTIQYAEGLGTVAHPISLMNTSQYLKMRHDAFNYDKPYDAITPLTAPDLLIWDTTRYTNWVKNLLGGIGHTNNIQLAFNQASKLNSWYLDLTGFRETSVFPITPVHQRANTCFSFDHHDKNNTWNVHLTGLAGIDDNQQFILLDPTSFIFLAPDAPALRNPNGSLSFSPYSLNPLSFLEQSYQALSHNYLVSGLVDYSLLSWLTLKTELGFNNIGNHEIGQTPISAEDPVGQSTATVYFAHTTYSNRSIEPQAEVRKQWGKTAVDLLLGFSWQEEKASLNSLIDTGYVNDNYLRKPSRSNELMDTTYPSTDYQYCAWFGRLNFNYDELFILNLTDRRDGSSRFGPGIQYANFYAVGAAFLFSHLPAVHDALPFLSLGKLRGSFGVTGNDQIGDHRQQGYIPVSEPSFDNIPGFSSSSQVAAGAAWETIHKEELALDLGFIHDRILLTAARYRHQSTDQLLPLSYPVAGVPDVFRNWPAMLQNKGWEFSLSARIVDEKELSWSIGVNWTLPVNKLISFPDLAQTPFAQTLLVGQPLSVLQGWLSTGVDPTTGLFKFQHFNNADTLTQADQRVIGHLDATGFGGLHTEFRFKHIWLQATMDARHTTGNSSITTLYLNNPPGSVLGGLFSNAPSALTKRWETPGQQASYQQVTTDLNTPAGREISYYTGSSARLTNASFVRLKTLKISYMIADSALKHLHMSNVTLFIAGQDLLTFTHYKGADPEIQNPGILPPLRIIEMGFNVGI